MEQFKGRLVTNSAERNETSTFILLSLSFHIINKTLVNGARKYGHVTCKHWGTR